MARFDYVEFVYPGILFPETSVRRVDTRDVNALRPFPRGAFAFTFYAQDEAVGDGGRKMTSAPYDRTGRHYIGGEVFAVDALPDVGDGGRMAGAARVNEWSRLIRCRHGNWQPFFDADAVVAADVEVPNAR